MPEKMFRFYRIRMFLFRKLLRLDEWCWWRVMKEQASRNVDAYLAQAKKKPP